MAEVVQAADAVDDWFPFLVEHRFALRELWSAETGGKLKRLLEALDHVRVEDRGARGAGEDKAEVRLGAAQLPALECGDHRLRNRDRAESRGGLRRANHVAEISA